MSIATAFDSSQGTLSPPWQFRSPLCLLSIPFWVPRKLASRWFRYVASLTLRKSPWFTEWSRLTSVLLLVWAWIWIPRTMRKAQEKNFFPDICKNWKIQKSTRPKTECVSEVVLNLSVWVLSADQGPWDIPRGAWKCSSLNGNTKTSQIFPTLRHYPLGLLPRQLNLISQPLKW